MLRRMLGVLLLTMLGVLPALAAAIDEELAALRPIIGAYPPAIKSAEERTAVIAKYKLLKSRLDADVAARPDDPATRLQRATLEDMGHNIDLKGAFEQARADYGFILKSHPDEIPALVGLAALLVNTNPTYASEAKSLFLRAQCSFGKDPLEEAQRGLFFANYYLGKLSDAKARSRYLVKHWPDNPAYRQIDETVDKVLARSQNSVKVADVPDLETCKGNP